MYRVVRTMVVWMAALLGLLYIQHDIHRAAGGAMVVGILWALGERYFGRLRDV